MILALNNDNYEITGTKNLVHSDYPFNNKYGRFCIYYKNYLPLKVMTASFLYITNRKPQLCFYIHEKTALTKYEKCLLFHQKISFHSREIYIFSDSSSLSPTFTKMEVEKWDICDIMICLT